MGINRRDIVQMLRRENDALKARNQKLGTQLIRHRQAFRALERMDEVMREMRLNFDLKRVINDLLALALHACDSENGSLVLIDDEADELVFAEVIGETREQLVNHRISIDTGIVGHVVKTHEAMLVTDVHRSSQWSSEVDQAIGFNTNALMCAPLYDNDTTYGAIEVVNNRYSDVFDENDLAILRVTARFVSQALRQAEDITTMEGEFS